MNDVFKACDDCYSEGKVNALYYDGAVVECPIHGVVDSQRMTEYRQAGCQFLLVRAPKQIQPVLSNGGTA